MAFRCLTAAVFVLSLSEVSCLTIANSSSLTCNQMVPCDIQKNNCMYKEWMKPQHFTPTSPVDLKVHVDVRTDENRDLVPVIVAEWKARDDGSIIHLTGTEFQVTKQGSGEHFCVHYIFHNKITTMRTPSGEQWSFYLDKVVVEPGETYLVSVSNLPKPNLAHTSYNINKTIEVSGCKSPAMQSTRICIERGENWNPNISMVKSGHQNRTLFVTFDTDEHSESYKVHLKCKEQKETQNLSKENGSSLNVAFDLEAWPHTCCSFTVEIQPFFKCGNDCLRKKKSFNICPDPPKPLADADHLWKVFTGLFVLLCGLCTICIICLRCRKQKKGTEKPVNKLCPSDLPNAECSVLIIYSRDHPKYTDIVLKLCAFLRAKCGTEVYLDLLDTASIGAMGRLQWTELQKRRIEQSSDKVLVLCSRGVQAKWGAMCGEPRVLLREDVCSPMGDMLTLALQLITPDMQRPASYAKYLVAYFEDISDEYDVPSMFDVAVKYKLMKHFEELFFRIVDLEKYQKGMVHTFKGIGIDDYISCPSGKALRDAIETFQAYQLENPDWFEKECLASEDEVPVDESRPFLNGSPTPVHKCEPVLNIGPSVCKCEVEIHPMDQTHSVWSTEIPHLNLEYEEPSDLDIQPACQEYSLHPVEVVKAPLGIYKAGVCHADLENHPCLLVEPVLREPLPSSRNEVYVNSWPPTEDSPAIDKEEALKKLLNLQVSLVSVDITAPPPSVDDQFQTSWDMHSSQPMEIDENQVEEASGKRQSRFSDQGYSSRDSMVREEPPPASLAALAKLQEALYLNSPISSGFCTETMES